MVEQTIMKIYSIKEAAAELSVSPSYVYYLIATKQLKAKKIGAQYTLSQAEIDRYRDGQKNESSR